jgi:hypothetical protein
MKILCDCGDLSDVPDDFFDGGTRTFWKAHQHFPYAVTFICDCGERLPIRLADSTGYLKDAWRITSEWRSQHAAHTITVATIQ